MQIYKAPLNDIKFLINDFLKLSKEDPIIAKKDLEIRGPGEILGTKQSGLPSFKIADLSFDSELLEETRKYVYFIEKNDPRLESTIGKNLQNLLHLFERDIAIKTLLAG